MDNVAGMEIAKQLNAIARILEAMLKEMQWNRYKRDGISSSAIPGTE